MTIATPRTTLSRRAGRGLYDRPSIDAILDAGWLCHLAVTSEEAQPFVLPLLYARRGDDVLFHVAVGGRLSELLRGGAAVCLTVTHVDGIVLARSAFHHSMN